MAYTFIRDRDIVMFEDLALKIDTARRDRRWSILQMAAAARIQPETVKKIIYGGRGTIVSLLRMLDAADYDIVLVKRPRQKKFWEIEGAEEQLHKLKVMQLKSKQNGRRKFGSLKEELDRYNHELDFMADEEDV